MVKCPNCGSTAHMVRIALDYVTYSHAIEMWRCSCDCMVRRTMKAVNQITEYPNGRVESEDKR